MPADLVRSSTCPGGDENFSCTLARQPARDYPDLAPLSRLTLYGAGGEIGQYRLERTPRVSGDQIAISPAAVGGQAYLSDDESAQVIYVDADPSQWVDAPLARKIALGLAGISMGDFSFSNEAGSGLVCALPNSPLGAQTIAEAWYTAPPGTTIGDFMFIADATAKGLVYEPNALFSPSDDAGSSLPSTAIGNPFDGALHEAAPAAASRYAMLRVYSDGAAGTPAAGASDRYSLVAVYGDHGLTLHAIDATTAAGVLCSDVEAHALATWAPEIAFTTGSDGTIRPSSFVIPQLAFRDLPNTAGAIIRAAVRFELRDWAVWGSPAGPVYYSNERGARGRTWRARVGPAQLEETGPQVDRLWSSIVGIYTDVDGSTRMVGPPGSGADTEDASLQDLDPDNPAVKAGARRRDALVLGTSTPAGAIRACSEFLSEAKALDTSGRARLVGYVEDDRGVVHPASAVRAGDKLEFSDAADRSARRILREEYTTRDMTCAVDLDSPPEGLQQLLERYGASIVSLGF